MKFGIKSTSLKNKLLISIIAGFMGLITRYFLTKYFLEGSFSFWPLGVVYLSISIPIVFLVLLLLEKLASNQ
jgi:hypothetical protein